MSDDVAAPGFRVTADELSNADAVCAMREAATAVVRAALDARLALLRLGFAADHSLCKQLDETAREYAIGQEVLLRQAAQIDGDG